MYATDNRSRILLLMPQTTYRAQPFLEAASKLGLEVMVGSDRCRQLAEIWPIDVLPLDLRLPEAAAETALLTDQGSLAIPLSGKIQRWDGPTAVRCRFCGRAGRFVHPYPRHSWIERLH